MLSSVRHRTRVMRREPDFQIVGYACIESFSLHEALQNINILPMDGIRLR